MTIEAHCRGHQDSSQHDRARERLTELMARYGHHNAPADW
jgi:hypothetical protein